MSSTTSRHRFALAGSLVALGAGITLLGGTGSPASAQTAPTTVNTVVLHMSGAMNFKLDKTFLKTIKASKAKVSVKEGAKYRKSTITLPVDSSTTIELTPGSADVLGNGTVVIRRPDGRKVVVQDIALRLRPTGADLSGTVRGRPQREFSALTISPTTAINQNEGGYSFVDVQMLVSPDLATAAKKAKIKNVRAGALLGLMTAEIQADLPSFTLPGLGGLIPGT